MINRLIYIFLLASSTSLVSSGQQGQKKYCMPPKIGFELPLLPSSLVLAKNDTDANKADKKYTEEHPRWEEEYKTWYPDAMWKRAFIRPSSALGVLDRALGNPLLKTRNLIMSPIDAWQESQKKNIEARVFDLLRQNGQYGPVYPSDSLSWVSTFSRYFRGERYGAWNGGCSLSEQKKAINRAEKIRKRNRGLTSYFWRNCSEFHGQRDFKTSFDYMIYLVGAKGLPDILAKDTDVGSIIDYPRTLFDHFKSEPTLRTNPRFSVGKYGDKAYAVPIADLMVAFIKGMIRNKHIDHVYDYKTAIDELGIRDDLDTIHGRLSINSKNFPAEIVMLSRLKIITNEDLYTYRDGLANLFNGSLPDNREQLAKNIYYIDLLMRSPGSIKNMEWFACHNDEKLEEILTEVRSYNPNRAKSARK